MESPGPANSAMKSENLLFRNTTLIMQQRLLKELIILYLLIICYCEAAWVYIFKVFSLI